MIKIGSHVKFKSPHYLVGSVEESIKNGANAAMIFIGPPQSTRRVDPERYKKTEYLAQYRTIMPQEDIVVHGPYIVNPSNPEKAAFAFEFLKQEIARINYLGLKYLVLHPGSATKFSKEDSLASLVKTLKQLLAETENVEILLETMSGKGTENGAEFSEMKAILDAVDSKRLGVCLDTCHVWDAGYDLHNYSQFIATYRKFGLLAKTKVIHINDSKNVRGAHKDRHANIGQGFIGLAALQKIVQGAEFIDAIKVLETPIPASGSIYDAEIKMLIGV